MVRPEVTVTCSSVCQCCSGTLGCTRQDSTRLSSTCPGSRGVKLSNADPARSQEAARMLLTWRAAAVQDPPQDLVLIGCMYVPMRAHLTGDLILVRVSLRSARFPDCTKLGSCAAA